MNINNSPFKKYINVRENLISDISRDIFLFGLLDLPSAVLGLSGKIGKKIIKSANKIYDKEGKIQYYKFALSELLNELNSKSDDCNLIKDMIKKEYCILNSLKFQLNSLNKLRSKCRNSTNPVGCNNKIITKIVKIKSDIYKQTEKINKLEVDQISMNTNRT